MGGSRRKLKGSENQDSIEWGELKTKTNFLDRVSILVYFFLRSKKNKDKNDKQRSQRLIDDSSLRRFSPFPKLDNPKTICKQCAKELPRWNASCIQTACIRNIDATSPILGTEWLNMIINQHWDSHLHKQNKFYKLDFPSFQFRAASISKYEMRTKQAPSNNIQWDYWTKQRSMNPIFINRWETSLQNVCFRTFRENIMSGPNTMLKWSQTHCWQQCNKSWVEIETHQNNLRKREKWWWNWTCKL